MGLPPLAPSFRSGWKWLESRVDPGIVEGGRARRRLWLHGKVRLSGDKF